MFITSRWRAAVFHLLLSAAVAGLVATLVFGVWFPSPLRELVGGTELFWLIVGVDVVCGPLLTLVVFNPAKPRAELRRDLALVALIQVFALGYGVHTLAYARPVGVVFEVDRFRALCFSDLDEADAAVHAPQWARPWSLSSPRVMGLRDATTPAERRSSLEASLQGVEPSQRPSWWQDYALSAAEVLQRAHPLNELQGKRPDQHARIDAAVRRAVDNHESGETTDGTALRWLPLVSRRAMDWVVLIDPKTARIRAYAHVDGFLD